MDDIIVIVGPTGVGKTKLSIELAKKIDAEIINGDSVAIYKNLDIGSAKPTVEERENIKHHLIDVREVEEEYSVYDYQKDVRNLIKEISSGAISNTAGKTVFEEILNTGKNVKEIIEEKGLAQVNDENEISEMVDRVLERNEQSIIDYKKGKTNVVGFLVGQVMKESKGKGNPQIINNLIRTKLESK